MCHFIRNEIKVIDHIFKNKLGPINRMSTLLQAKAITFHSLHNDLSYGTNNYKHLVSLSALFQISISDYSQKRKITLLSNAGFS